MIDIAIVIVLPVIAVVGSIVVVGNRQSKRHHHAHQCFRQSRFIDVDTEKPFPLEHVSKLFMALFSES